MRRAAWEESKPRFAPSFGRHSEWNPSIGRQWVFEYGLAIVKEILGYVRGKYSTVPIPGSEVTLNQGDLISAATTEKQALIERLRAYLDTTSRKVLLENKSLEAEFQNKTIAQVPMTIFILINKSGYTIFTFTKISSNHISIKSYF